MHPRIPPFDYQRQDSPLTLSEGLEEYYTGHIGRVARPHGLPPESYDLFRNHDFCHVIFGLDTTLDDEVLADVRTLIACDVGFRGYIAYLAKDRQAQSLFKEIGYLRSTRVTLMAIPRICRAVLESWRMKRRWPWTPPESFQRRSLADLRREFGIRVI
jgi:hypothetical protein